MASPTVRRESLLTTLAIAAYKGRTVATSDVRGAFLLPYSSDFFLIKVDGDIVNIMCDANPGYQKYIVKEFGKDVLYLISQNALYGILQAAIMWCETFTTCLERNGFKINPYNRCVENKDKSGRQCTV